MHQYQKLENKNFLIATYRSMKKQGINLIKDMQLLYPENDNSIIERNYRRVKWYCRLGFLKKDADMKFGCHMFVKDQHQ